MNEQGSSQYTGLANEDEYEGQSASPASPDSPHDAAANEASRLMASLSSRGKGSYVCPYGPSCRKGGVKPNGEIVVFERNSAFKLVP